MTARCAIIVSMGIFSLAGCHSAVQQQVDSLVCTSAGKDMDAAPLGFQAAPPKREVPPLPPIDPKNPDANVFVKRLDVPALVAGSDAPRILLPENFAKLSPKDQKVALDRFFKSQMEVGSDPQPVAGPDGHPLSLKDLQKLAREHSPLLRQAASDIEAYEGLRIQAGVCYNPTLSYGSSPVSFTSGNVVGPGISQTIRTMGKGKLAEESARMDVENAKLAYRRAETDLMANIRSNYFAVLIAEEGMRSNRGLMVLTDELYKVMLQQLRSGVVAPYEPAQLGVFAGQARIAYVQSRNSYFESWKMLATSIGLTMMPATQLTGNVAGELPRFDFEKSLAHVLNNHTDALTAVNGVVKARLNLRLQEVTAYPDVTVGATVFNDNSNPGPPRFVPTLMASIPVPVFDRNQGNIRNAQAALMRAVEQPHATQNALTSTFADAYRRLEENRQILELYRLQLLPQQVQAFRATVLRHNGIGPQENLAPGASTAYYSDVITAEQNLVSLISTYLSTLGSYWQAVSDTACLLQIDDAYQMAVAVEKMPELNLAELLNLPCCHPCSSLQTAGACNTGAYRTADAKAAQPVSPKGPIAYKLLPEVLPEKMPDAPAPAAEREVSVEGRNPGNVIVLDFAPPAGVEVSTEGPSRQLQQPALGGAASENNAQSLKGGTR